MTNRRRFIKNSIASGLIAALTPGPLIGSLSKAVPLSAGYIQLERLIGTHFMVIAQGGRLTQLEITGLLKGSADPCLEQFYLYLTSTSFSSLQERSYHMHHPALGDQHIFLQPLDQSSHGPHYRATFSLLIDAPMPPTA